jgi:hypothetical protein
VAVTAGSRSFAAIGQWAADAGAGADALAGLGAAGGPAEESTFRRAFAMISADVLDQVLGAWLHTRSVQAGGRLVIAVDGKAVRGAKDKDGRALHLVAAPAWPAPSSPSTPCIPSMTPRRSSPGGTRTT